MSKSNTLTPQCYTLLKRYGYRYELVEKWISGRGRQWRKDLFGFGDILALRPLDFQETAAVLNAACQLHGSLCIQACAEGSIQAHLRKVTEGEPRDALRDWLLCGNRFELWGFPDRSRKSRYRTVPSASGRPTRVLNARFIRVTYECLAPCQPATFCQEPTTELTLFGYVCRD